MRMVILKKEKRKNELLRKRAHNFPFWPYFQLAREVSRRMFKKKNLQTSLEKFQETPAPKYLSLYQPCP